MSIARGLEHRHKEGGDIKRGSVRVRPSSPSELTLPLPALLSFPSHVDSLLELGQPLVCDIPRVGDDQCRLDVWVKGLVAEGGAVLVRVRLLLGLGRSRLGRDASVR